MKTPVWWYSFRSAITGRKITPEVAAAHPETSVRERNPRFLVIRLEDLIGMRIEMFEGEETISDYTIRDRSIVLHFRQPHDEPTPQRRHGNDQER